MNNYNDGNFYFPKSNTYTHNTSNNVRPKTSPPFYISSSQSPVPMYSHNYNLQYASDDNIAYPKFGSSEAHAFVSQLRNYKTPPDVSINASTTFTHVHANSSCSSCNHLSTTEWRSGGPKGTGPV